MRWPESTTIAQTVEELRQSHDEASPQNRAMVGLGINALFEGSPEEQQKRSASFRGLEYTLTVERTPGPFLADFRITGPDVALDATYVITDKDAGIIRDFLDDETWASYVSPEWTSDDIMGEVNPLRGSRERLAFSAEALYREQLTRALYAAEAPSHEAFLGMLGNRPLSTVECEMLMVTVACPSPKKAHDY